MHANPIATRNLLQIQQAGVVFDAKLVKLIKLVTNAARFGGLFLRQTTRNAKFSQSLSESA